ncbi:MAG TPA: hypothetical protein VFR68_11180 [Candidatus Dormibacteraeota bacterium]|nr:hypothetical protein [Candidatus Dormibacteraeota bacterium]
MIISMTNRLLSVVIAIALSSGIAAHAAQAPQRPLAPASLPGASSLPFTLQTAVSHISETATSTVDPAAAIRDAYQRDHVALEHLRQQASQLKGSAHPAFNQLITDDETTLTEIERTALATSRPAAGSTIDAMDKLVASAEAELNQQLALASKAQNPKPVHSSKASAQSGNGYGSGSETGQHSNQ